MVGKHNYPPAYLQAGLSSGTAASILTVGTTAELTLLDERTIESEELCDAFALRHLRGEAVCGHDGAVVLLMRMAQVGRHRQLVVEDFERTVGMRCTCVKNGLCRLLNS